MPSPVKTTELIPSNPDKDTKNAIAAHSKIVTALQAASKKPTEAPVHVEHIMHTEVNIGSK
jgi:hypothetical protein